MIQMPYEDVVAKIKEKSGLSDSEIENKVSQKLEQLSGLISKEGAAHIIANELGVKIFEQVSGKLQIKNILTGMRDVETKGKAESKDNVETKDVQIKDADVEDVRAADIKPKKIGAYRILGQLNRTYIIAENPEGLLLIDQHAAEERVNYELLMEEYKDKGIKVQQLMKPKIIELSPAESNVIKENLELLRKAGFKFEEYGTNSFVVRTIPAIFGIFYGELVTDLIKELDSISTKKIDSIKEEKIIRFACRKSVKAGEELTIPQIEDLMRRLDNTRQPFSCPHGRPTIISVTIGELEKKFKRVA